MRPLRLIGLLLVMLGSGCAASMQARDAAAVRECTETLPVHEGAEADRYAAVTEVSGWTVEELVLEACELGAHAVVGMHRETFRTAMGGGEVLFVGHAARRVKRPAKSATTRRGRARPKPVLPGSCAATLPLYVEPMLEGYAIIDAVVGWSHQEIAQEACAMGAEAVVAVKTEELGVTGLAGLPPAAAVWSSGAAMAAIYSAEFPLLWAVGCGVLLLTALYGFRLVLLIYARPASTVRDERPKPLPHPAAAALDWIGMPVSPRFLRNSKLKPTDVYFVPAAE